jgi:hypothetical protein
MGSIPIIGSESKEVVVKEEEFITKLLITKFNKNGKRKF